MKKSSKLMLDQNSSQSQISRKEAQDQNCKKTDQTSVLEVQELDSVDSEVLNLIEKQANAYLNKTHAQKAQDQKQKRKTCKNIPCRQNINCQNQKFAGESQQSKTMSLTIPQQKQKTKITKILSKQEDQEKQAKQNKNHFDFYKYKYSKYEDPQRKNPNQFDLYTSYKNNSAEKMNVVDPTLLENQHYLQIDKIPIYFPYQPYPLQVEYMGSIIKTLQLSKNALLQSPTGTGKTLCLLCSVLSWVENYSRLQKSLKNNGQKIRVIYLSRTHTQLKQVQSQLKKTCFRPTMANFGSRDQFCIKSEYSEFKGRDLMEACSKGVKLALKAKRKLQIQQFVEKQELNLAKINEEGHACRFYKSEGQYLDIADKMYKNKLVDSEKIKRDGQAHGFCPYYYPFQIQEKADIIFMPYNYILDVGLLSRYQEIIKNSIVIFDEAHNVPQAACQGRSMNIFSGIFDHIKVELAKLQEHPRMSPELKQISYEYQKIIQLIEKNVTLFRKKISDYIEIIFHQSINQNQRQVQEIQKITKPIGMRKIFYSWFYPGTIDGDIQLKTTKEKKQIHFNTLRNLKYLVEQAALLIQAIKQTFDGIFQNMEKFIGFLLKVSELIQTFEDDLHPEWWNEEINHFRLAIKINSKDKEFYQIKLVCLTPNLTFKQILQLKPRSIVMTSGTLSPLEAWQKQLKVKFEVKLVNPHIIQPSQLHLATVCRSAQAQIPMNFSFQSIGNRKETYYELVASICSILDRVPHGVLVIFPSYRIITSFKNQLRYNQQARNRIKQVKEFLFEERGTDDYLLERFKQKARTARGAALFCVSRGKVSEGLDFSDELCRAVIFIGVPFPNIRDPIIIQKKDYCDRLARQHKSSIIKGLTGDQWYNLNTMRAVNQGIGRVIRHINDFGMIFLLDERYEQFKLKNMLPKWSKINSKAYDNFDEMNDYIANFFIKMKTKFPQRQKILEKQQTITMDPVEQKKPKNAFEVLMSRKPKKNDNKSRGSSKGGYNSKLNRIDDFL